MAREPAHATGQVKGVAYDILALDCVCVSVCFLLSSTVLLWTLLVRCIYLVDAFALAVVVVLSTSS